MTTDTETKPDTHQFAAETSRVLQLMIHALYTNRDIFLRELISNASDACDKLRFASLTNESLITDQPEFTISLKADEKAGTLTITDTGIGMNREDLIANLGTIARSGTSEFLNNLSGDTSKDVNLIGQFGVGFYSAFMVADKITVETRKAGEDQSWLWESDGVGSYSIAPGADRPRGTSITMHLKPDTKEYLDRHRLEYVVGTYSDHIGFPISLTDSENITHHLNEGSAIWVRPKSEISEEQYEEFYHHVSHSPEKPWATFHNKAEGKVEYTNLLYIPGIKPLDLFHPERKRRVKLYVKRVYITEEGVELIPPYLRFLRGVIDSADLPLNISRETLQKSPVLDTIRDSVTNRILGELKKRAEKEPEEYAVFWNNFGAALKEGLCESMAPREKILECCAFYTSTSPDKLTTLAEYKSRMKEGQEAIYFITGDQLEILKHSPQLEGFTARGIEVLLLTDHVDDFWVNVTQKFGDVPFRSVVKAGSDLDNFEPEGAQNEEVKVAETSEATASLIEAMTRLYGDAVREVRTTRKLSETPICLSVAEGDMDLRMERFLAEHKQLPRRAAKIIEINPTHSVIQSLAARINGGGLTQDTEDALWLLLDQAMIAEGEPVTDASAFARRLSQFLAKGLAA